MLRTFYNAQIENLEQPKLKKTDLFLRLPAVLERIIFEYLDAESLANANSVSRYWKKVTNCDNLWEILYIKRYSLSPYIDKNLPWKENFTSQAKEIFALEDNTQGSSDWLEDTTTITHGLLKINEKSIIVEHHITQTYSKVYTTTLGIGPVYWGDTVCYCKLNKKSSQYYYNDRKAEVGKWNVNPIEFSIQIKSRAHYGFGGPEEIESKNNAYLSEKITDRLNLRIQNIVSFNLLFLKAHKTFENIENLQKLVFHTNIKGEFQQSDESFNFSSIQFKAIKIKFMESELSYIEWDFVKFDEKSSQSMEILPRTSYCKSEAKEERCKKVNYDKAKIIRIMDLVCHSINLSRGLKISFEESSE